MLRHKHIDRICCIVLALTLFLSVVFVGTAALGLITEENAMGYEARLFDQSRVHTLDIEMEDWESFLSACTSEEYATCDITVDGEVYRNVAIRGKGNTSLSSVAAYGNDRYSFKVEFDHYQTGYTYHGLDKLSLNNLIQDNTYMKDYFAYTLMNKMGVASPLCSFVQIRVNGEYWGLYLAVEGVEDAFLQRNYGKNHGELYKPDSMSFGGGRGNGRDFNMDDVSEQFGFSFGENGVEGDAAIAPGMNRMPDGGNMPQMPDMGGMTMGQLPQNVDPAQMFGRNDGEGPAMPFWQPDVSPESAGNGTGKKGGFGGFGSSADVKLQYTGDDPANYTNIFSNAKTEITATDQARLIASLKALGEGDVSVVDTLQVIRYMAVHNFLCNDDSYTGMMVHNYYLYEEDGVMAMIPWDYNLAYGGFSGGFSGGSAAAAVNTDINSLVSSALDSDRPMAGWITAGEEYTAQYLSVYEEFMARVFDSGWFAEEIDRVTAMIDPYVKEESAAFCTYEEFKTAAETLKSFCLKRAQSVKNQLNGDNTPVDAAELDLSVMGTMNNRGVFGGRGEKDDFGFPGGMGGGFGNVEMPQGGWGNMQENPFPFFGGQMQQPPDQPSDQFSEQPSEQSSDQPSAVDPEQAKQAERQKAARMQSDSVTISPDRRETKTAGNAAFVACCIGLLPAALVGTGLIQNKR